MANLSALTGAGGISTVNHYKVTSPAATTGFALTKTITAVADINKTIVVLNGVHTTGNPTSYSVMLHLASTTSVEYVASAGLDFSFSVIEYS